MGRGGGVRLHHRLGVADLGAASKMIDDAAYHEGERLLWFVGPDLHCDGWVFAAYRGLPEEATQYDIEQAVFRRFGRIEVHFDTQKEIPLTE